MRTRIATATALTGGLVIALAAGVTPASAAGVTSPAIAVDGALYRTVATPTDLSGTGGPSHSWDVIYALGGNQPYNVATAAPGDRDYYGGRWQVHLVSFPEGFDAALEDADTNGNGYIDSDAELGQAFAMGTAVDEGVVAAFECPVIPVPKGRM